MDFHPENLTRDLGGSGASTPVVNAIPVKDLSVENALGLRWGWIGIKKEDIIT